MTSQPSKNILKSLEDYCIGTAEAESGFLRDVFVDSGRYNQLIDTMPGSPRLLIGKKGTGKSAILKYMENKANEAGLTIILMKPDDLLGEGIDQSINDIATLKKHYYTALINSIAVRLGAKLQGLITSRNDQKLFEKAIHHGYRGHDFVQLSLKTLAKYGSVIDSIDFTKLIPDSENIETEALRLSIKEKISRSGSKVFFLLIDDIDQVSAPSSQTNRIWAFLLACRKFCEEIPVARCFISIRTEVWQHLYYDKSGQRDQIDHFQRLLYTLDPTDDEIKIIIQNRLKFVAKVSGLSIGSENPYNTFFDSKTLNLPMSEDEERTWKSFLVSNSRNRPRDAIQYLALLAKISNEKKLPKISDSIIEKAARLYSEERFDQLATEYADDCQVCDQIIREFSGLDFVLEAEKLIEFLSGMPSKFGIVLRGQTLHPSVEQDVFTLWRFLHQTGFINPRFPDARAPKKFSHIKFENDPKFVSKSNWNEMKTAEWEIHPAYRYYLISLREEKESRKFKFF